MNNFYYKTRKINAGSRSHQCSEECGPLLCKKCDAKAAKINVEEKFASNTCERGASYHEWEVITYECPKCKVKEEYRTHARESCKGDGVATRHMGYGT